MRLLKAQNTNLRNIYGKGIKYDINGQVIMDSSNVLLVPKGTTLERPSLPNNGHLRYNTSVSRFEVYEGNIWVFVSNSAPAGVGSNAPITQQNLGNGDATETVFGPLDSQDPDPTYTVPAAAQNVLVFVENVFQIAGTNYTLEQSVSGSLTGPNAPYADGFYLKFTSAPDLGKPITVLHNFDK